MPHLSDLYWFFIYSSIFCLILFTLASFVWLQSSQKLNSKI